MTTQRKKLQVLTFAFPSQARLRRNLLAAQAVMTRRLTIRGLNR
jgi:hypothetical protein